MHLLKVSGVALDVFEQEPPTDSLTLEIIQHPAVIATPHLGKSVILYSCIIFPVYRLTERIGTAN